jgi:glucose/arabinose dehydrogenase
MERRRSVCHICGLDNKLFIQRGQPFNVPTKEGHGGIIRMDRDGKNREIYATGLRNPFNPNDKTLWSNDNQVVAWATISRPAK